MEREGTLAAAARLLMAALQEMGVCEGHETWRSRLSKKINIKCATRTSATTGHMSSFVVSNSRYNSTAA